MPDLQSSICWDCKFCAASRTGWGFTILCSICRKDAVCAVRVASTTLCSILAGKRAFCSLLIRNKTVYTILADNTAFWCLHFVNVVVYWMFCDKVLYLIDSYLKAWKCVGFFRFCCTVQCTVIILTVYTVCRISCCKAWQLTVYTISHCTLYIQCTVKHGSILDVML